MPLSAQIREDIMEHLFGIAAWTAPTNIYLSLHTAEPNSSGSNERPTTGGYTRVNVTGLWTVPTGDGVATLNGPIYFPQATTSWGTITHVGLWSAASGGTFLGWAALGAGVVVNSGSRFYFPDDGFSFTFEFSTSQGFAPAVMDKILNHLLGLAAWTMGTPKARWMSLHTAASTPLAPGSLGSGEIATGSYARIDTDGKIGVGTVDGILTNSAELLFPQATADWGSIGKFGLHGTISSAAVDILYVGGLDTPITVNNQNVASFPAAELNIELG